jgi:K+-sensing histidine kinase KdpD
MLRVPEHPGKATTRTGLEDQGPGISANELPKIFNSFYQGQDT